MLNRILIFTEDGSHSLFVPQWNEHFHSKFGAIQEANHVFIKNGLQALGKREISILEIGFGTGLNALLTYFETKSNNLKVNYTAIEAFPVNELEFKELNYCKLLNYPDCQKVFDDFFCADWNEEKLISPHFNLLKINKTFQEVEEKNLYDLIFFDAFGPNVQPELWTEDIFMNMHQALKNEGILVTYSAKGSVRRALQSVGFVVERLPGPAGKREMLRGRKICF